MDRQSEDDAWRAIVEHYGDRAALDDVPSEAANASSGPAADVGFLDRALGRHADHDAAPPEPPAEADPGPRPPSEIGPDPAPERAVEPDATFVPPTPPPLPPVAPRRLVAWLGVLVAPAVLVVCLVAGLPLPSLAAMALVAWFVGGFVYLVLVMPRGPRDPWDNGARV